jgi:hypothetical protein
MTPETAEQRMNDIQASQRPALPILVQKLALSYGLPLGAALLLATVGAVLLSQVIPSSTATAIVFALNVGLFYYGWNYMEKRTQATALFATYSAGVRERRTLAKLIQQAKNGNTEAQKALPVQLQRYEGIARDFVERVT